MWFYCLYISSYYFIALNLKIKKAIFDAPFFIMFEMYYLKFKILYIPFWKIGWFITKFGVFLGGGVIIVILLFHFFYLWQENVFLKGWQKDEH